MSGEGRAGGARTACVGASGRHSELRGTLRHAGRGPPHRLPPRPAPPCPARPFNRPACNCPSAHTLPACSYGALSNGIRTVVTAHAQQNPGAPISYRYACGEAGSRWGEGRRARGVGCCTHGQPVLPPRCWPAARITAPAAPPAPPASTLVTGVRQALAQAGFSQNPCLECSEANADGPFIVP